MIDRQRAVAVAFIVGAAALLIPLRTPAAEPLLQPGTFQQINPETKKVLDPGNQIVFVRGKTGRLSFSLNAIRALDLNQGFVAGTLPAAGSRVVWTQQIAEAKCRLTFAATGGLLDVVQDAGFGDCGFGYGVSAGGTYRRTGSGGRPGPGGGS